MLKPGTSRTFEEYSEKVFKPYVTQQLQNRQRLDIVWDEYHTDSLKATARSHRGRGVRRRVKPDTRLPGNWEAFLRNDENKAELFSYLAEQSVAVECQPHQQVVSTKGQNVISSRPRPDITNLAPCNQEEADTRLGDVRGNLWLQVMQS